MKSYLTIIATLVLSACGGRNSPTPDQAQLNQNSSGGYLIEVGVCSDSFLNRFNKAELNLQNFARYRLRGAGYLVTAYNDFSSILSDYGKIKCLALDRESGQKTSVTKDYVAQYFATTKSIILEEYENCRYPSYPKDSDERNSCKIITDFLLSQKYLQP